jgi:serine/threonine protein kinase
MLSCARGERKISDDLLDMIIYRLVNSQIFLGIPFGTEIDIWSLGCLLCEIWLGKPLFQGSSQKEILESMMAVLGPLPEAMVDKGKYKELLATCQSKFSHLDSGTW